MRTRDDVAEAIASKVYAVIAPNGAIDGGEIYEDEALAHEVAHGLLVKEGKPWRVATYALETVTVPYISDGEKR